MRPKSIIALEVCAGYGSLEVLRGISMECRPGEVLLVIGHNGAGKTTLLRCLAGLLSPSSGQLTVDGGPSSPHHVAFLTQKDNVFKGKSVVRNLRIGLTGHFRSASRLQTREIIDFLEANFPDLLPRMNSPVAELSGGQQQMTALARTLLSSRDYLLLDEPTLGLSEQQAQKVLPTIRAVAKARGRGVVVVEHNLRLAVPYSDRVIVLRRGRITLECPAENISELKDIRDYYF